jgi:hypothetical protein
MAMKRRLLVMNGQKLIQSERGEGQWTTDKVEKAGTIKPGIYNLYLSVPADKARLHDGVILHLDKSHVYQQIGKQFVLHERESFSEPPKLGEDVSIKYDGGKAVVAASFVKRAHKLSI